MGPDPLRELIENDLELPIKHIAGGACVLGGKILQETKALAEHFGQKTCDEAEAFYARCAAMLRPNDYYSSARNVDNAHAWARISGEELLAREINDETARRYVRVMAHSDVAAPPHLTNGLTFLKNTLMDTEGYLNVFSVNGGNEQIVRRLADEIDAEVRLNVPVKSIQPLPDGTYLLEMGTNGSVETVIADYVVLALPLTALSIIEWKSAALQQAMARHINYFDRPGHYLRASLLFERPFWREFLQGAWWMSDAFDGCCIYDEGSRQDLGQWGVLGYLIAGNAALGLANMPDEQIVELCLDALPPELAHGRKLFVDSRIHRWMASVNAIPGGYPIRSAFENHRPNADQFPRLLTVGDYSFDATLNGVFDSADTASDIILSDILFRRQAERKTHEASVGPIVSAPAIAEAALCEQILEADFLADILEVTWGLRSGARILHIGSGAGSVVRALRALGFDAWGIEQNEAAWQQTPEEMKGFNILGTYTGLGAADESFDAVLETGLCCLSRKEIPVAVAELRRVARRGLILGSVTTDLTIDLIERNGMLSGVKTLTSRWDWSDFFLAVGFEFALADPALLDRAWKRAQAAGAGPGHWYEDAESLLYCFFEVGEASASDDLATAREAERIVTDRLYVDERVPV